MCKTNEISNFNENPCPWSQTRIDLEKYSRSFLQVSIANASRMTKRPRNTQNSLLQLLENQQTPTGGAPSSVFTGIACTCEGHAGQRGSGLKRGALKIKFPPSGHFCRTGTQWEGIHALIFAGYFKIFCPKVTLSRRLINRVLRNLVLSGVTNYQRCLLSRPWSSHW